MGKCLIAPLYTQEFIKGYRGYLIALGIENLPNEDTKKIKKTAHTDKETDLSRRKSLPNKHMIYQAVIRVYELLELDINSDIHCFEKLEENVAIYREEYEKYTPAREKEEHMDRSYRSDFR